MDASTSIIRWLEQVEQISGGRQPITASSLKSRGQARGFTLLIVDVLKEKRGTSSNTVLSLC
jgi:hypothetical protein